MLFLFSDNEEEERGVRQSPTIIVMSAIKKFNCHIFAVVALFYLYHIYTIKRLISTLSYSGNNHYGLSQMFCLLRGDSHIDMSSLNVNWT